MEHNTEESGLPQQASDMAPEQQSEPGSLDRLAGFPEVDAAAESAELPEPGEAAWPDVTPGLDEIGGPDETAGLNEIAEPDEMAGLADVHQPDAAGQGDSEPAEQEHQATGEPRVDEALRRLDELAELPVSGHPAVFEQVHARLREVLGELDLESGPVATAQRRQGG
jgi:hypothetical protein